MSTGSEQGRNSDDTAAPRAWAENQKNGAVLGHTALETKATGTVEQPPASSLVLFDRDGKVIWKAP